MAGLPEKGNSPHVETLAPIRVHKHEEFDAIPPEHQEYLLRRHGTIELDPLPDGNAADPYNWPAAKKITNLALVAFHAMMATFTAASILPAFAAIAEDLHVSITRTSYLASLQIAILGVAPLLWRPLSNRYGRRPIFLLSLLCSLAGNVGCGFSPTFATMGLCRAIVAFFISPAAAIGSAVVAECFFKKDRAKYMGVWTLLVTIGVPAAPFIFGFVAQRVGYRWIYYILAITNSVQFLLYLFLGPETRYIRRGANHAASTFKREYLTFARIDPTPLRGGDFTEPLTFVARPCVLIAAVSYAMIFLFGNVLIPIEIPQLFGEKFHFNTQQVGLQYIAMIIGSVLGEQIGGRTSDWWMLRRQKKMQTRPQPEFRLWLTYSGFILTIVGIVVFLVQLEQAPALHWNITPLVGAAIASGGNQIVTTVLITYAVDCYREHAASVGVFITLMRQTWGFIGPFWFPPMFTSIGLYGSAGLAAGLMIAFSVIPTMLLQWRGKSWR